MRFQKCLFLLCVFCAGLAHPSHATSPDDFKQFVDDLRPVAIQEGVRPDLFDEAMGGLTPDPSVLEAADNQAEFTRAIWDYLDRAVSDRRIERGLEERKLIEQELIAIERKYGVDRAVLVAIWGLESSYGAILDNDIFVKPVIRSLATLACCDQSRSRFGRTQLIAALKILQAGDTTPDKMTGSWAGAMGHTQFIPTTYLAHAVDYDGDGRRDIWGNKLDAIASAANYLRESGWVAGHGWGYEVKLPNGFDFSAADGRTRKTLREWKKLGVGRVRGAAFPRPDDEARLFLPAGHRGPAFLLLKNFDVIRRYNNANAYALAIGHLSDRLKGFGPFEQIFPRDLTVLNREQREELQQRLTAQGFDTGGVDGLVGPKTRAAIRAFQRSIGLVPDGFATLQTLERLRPDNARSGG
ncbi:MAG: lytic murein transglycosylase [Pseudomonadota bacterium]